MALVPSEFNSPTRNRPGWRIPSLTSPAGIAFVGAVTQRVIDYATSKMPATSQSIVQMGQKYVKKALKRKQPPSKLKKASKRIRKTKVRKALNFIGGGPGVYQGKFGRGGTTRNKFDTYTRYGFVTKTETNGVVADPDCCYITHTTIAPDDVITTLCLSIVRKLFYDGVKWDYQKETDVFPNLVPYRLFLEQRNVMDGASALIIFNGNTPSELVGSTEVSGNFAYQLAEFSQYSPGPNTTQTANGLQLYKIGLQENIGTVATPKWINRAELDLTTLKVHALVKTSIKIQNRSKSATGSSSTDEVNTNPLTGYKYNCFGPAPRMRYYAGDSWRLQSFNTITGVNLTRGSEVENDLREPPMAKQVVNCNKSAKIMLQPGEMKSDGLTYTKTMLLNQFLKKLFRRSGNGVGTNSEVTYGIGNSLMFAFEDAINVNSTENISLAFELERTTGVYVSPGKRQMTMTKFRKYTQDNVPA